MTTRTVPESLDVAVSVAQRVIDLAERLEGRELLDAAPVVRDMILLLMRLRPIESSTTRGGRGTPIAFTRADLAAACEPAGIWRTRVELRAVLGCSDVAFTKWWREYSAADARFESQPGGGRGRLALYRLRPADDGGAA